MGDRASENYDLVIQGGGLAGCLTLAAIRFRWPNLRVALVERAASLGGSHTWCCHHGDVPASIRPWFLPLVTKTWDSYEVKFPKYSRVLESAYHGLKSEDLHEKVMKISQGNIFLNSENLPKASWVLQATGWPKLSQQEYGFQKFVGLEVELEEPHGLSRVLLKDVTCEQTDGYRFFYLLPWSEKTLLVEDTYYSNSPKLSVLELDAGVRSYIDERGWKIRKILRRETGCLPLALYPEQEAATSGASVGARSGLSQPVTGYTLPHTLQVLAHWTESNDPSQNGFLKALEKTRHELAPRFSYLRLLNRMMFKAAKPAQRYKVLERFYQLPNGLIERFYSGRLNLWDRIRILSGKPPVPVMKALTVLKDQTPGLESQEHLGKE